MKDCAVLLGTILLEKNRWSMDNSPSFKVSEWLERFVADGFDGLELWQNHATLADEDEIAAIASGPMEISIYNSYATMDDAGQPDRNRAIELVKRFKSAGVKYNVGKQPDDREAEMKNLASWREAMPDDVCLLCECHPGTIIEEAAAAKQFFDEMKLDNWGVIVHALNRVETLEQWFDLFGGKVMHAHLQMREEDGKVVRINRQPQVADQAFSIMKKYGFGGSMTLEFTEGTRAENEHIDLLYTNALEDLKFVRERLAQ